MRRSGGVGREAAAWEATGRAARHASKRELRLNHSGSNSVATACLLHELVQRPGARSRVGAVARAVLAPLAEATLAPAGCHAPGQRF